MSILELVRDQRNSLNRAFLAGSLLGVHVVAGLLVCAGAGACSDDPATTPGLDAASAEGSTPDDSGAGTETGSEGGSDGGIDAPATNDLGSGPWSLAYAGTNIGIDQRTATASVVSGTKLEAYTASADEALMIGTNQAVDTGGSGPVIWGRWAGGTTAGKYYTSPAFTWTANGGLHYAFGRPTKTIPASGSPSYVAVGATKATVSDGSLATGTVAGTAGVVFGGSAATKIGLSLTVTVPGDTTYTVESTGGSATPASSQLDLFETSFIGGGGASPIAITSGGACTGGAMCIAAINGFFAGDDAERLAVVVHVFAGAGGNPKSVSGVIVFEKE